MRSVAMAPSWVLARCANAIAAGGRGTAGRGIGPARPGAHSEFAAAPQRRRPSWGPAIRGECSEAGAPWIGADRVGGTRSAPGRVPTRTPAPHRPRVVEGRRGPVAVDPAWGRMGP